MVVYNVSAEDLVAAYGTFEYTSPVGDVVLSEWEQFLVAPLVRPIQPVHPGESFTFKSFLDPSGSGYVKMRQIRCTGALFATGNTWGPQGKHLKAALASQLSDAYAQLLEIRTRLARCDKDEAASLLRASDPIAYKRRDTRLVHLTLQRMLFEDPDFKRLDPSFMQKIDGLVKELGGYLNE